MKIGLQAWGSEGDIRPFVALGHGLARRGHSVELLYTDITGRHYDHVAASLGFTARPVGMPVVADPQEVIRLGREAIDARDALTQGRLIDKHFFQPVVEPIYDAAVELCRRSDLLVGHFFLYPLRAAAEQAGKPEVSITFAHSMVPSRYIHPMGTPHLGEWGNRVFWVLARLALNVTMRPTVNRFRARVGLPALADMMDDAWSSHRLNLVTVSPAICPPTPDWPAWTKLCGFLALPRHEHEPLPPGVEHFLAAGQPPVFMGFGSLMPTESAPLVDTVAVMREAARLAGCRAIIQANVEPDAGDREVLVITRAPHAELFPRCAAVVHHAGAGTTHTTLAAGAPSVPVPHVSDQFGWADDLQRLGVAPRALPRRALTAPRLAARIRSVLATPAMKQRAVAMAARMKDDDGVGTAVRMIEEIA